MSDLRWLCPEHGITAVDEDGCCVTCGADCEVGFAPVEDSGVACTCHEADSDYGRDPACPRHRAADSERPRHWNADGEPCPECFPAADSEQHAERLKTMADSKTLARSYDDAAALRAGAEALTENVQLRRMLANTDGWENEERARDDRLRERVEKFEKIVREAVFTKNRKGLDPVTCLRLYALKLDNPQPEGGKK